jgi:hypothetical protein
MEWHQRKGGFDVPTGDAPENAANCDSTAQPYGDPLRGCRTFSTFALCKIMLLGDRCSYQGLKIEQ